MHSLELILKVTKVKLSRTKRINCKSSLYKIDQFYEHIQKLILRYTRVGIRRLILVGSGNIPSVTRALGLAAFNNEGEAISVTHILDTLDNRLTDGGEVVSLMSWPLFTPRKIPGTLPQGHIAAARIKYLFVNL
jgi:hypothetical protein